MSVIVTISTGWIDGHMYVCFGEQEQPLLDIELSVLPLLICARLVCSVVMSSYSYAMNPDNEYLLLTQQPGWKVLRTVRASTHSEFLKLITTTST